MRELWRILNNVVLLEAIVGFSLEDLLEQALHALPPGQRIILKSCFGLEDGVSKSPAFVAKSLGVQETDVWTFLQEALLSLVRMLQEMHAFDFSAPIQNPPKLTQLLSVQTRPTRATFEEAVEQVLAPRSPHSQTRMRQLFRNRDICSFEKLDAMMHAFGRIGKQICAEIMRLKPPPEK